MRLRLLTIFLLLIITSCQRKTRNTPTEIYGKWILDSTSGRGGKIVAGGPREHTEFILRPDKTFTFQWSDFDVFGDYSGTYNYENAVDTSSTLLIFSIFSSKISDSIIRLDSMIVLSLNDSILKTQERENYTLLDSPMITQNRINIYRKTAEPKH